MEQSQQNEQQQIEVPENANQDCPGLQSEEAGKKSACDGCPNQQKCSTGKGQEEDPSIELIKEKMKDIKHKILVLSGKGGVGKSTVSAQLALSLAKQGYEVGLMDLDLCGPSIPRMMGIEGQEVHQSNEGWSPVYVDDNLGVISIGFLLGNKDDAVIWRGPRKNGLIKQFLLEVAWGKLDFLIIDTPPGTSDEHISIVQLMKTTENDGAVIVTTPQEVALLDVRKEISFCRKTNTQIIGVIENMSGFVCPSCSNQYEIFLPITGGATQMCKDQDLKLLGQIPLDPMIMLRCEQGRLVGDENDENNQNNDIIQQDKQIQERFKLNSLSKSYENTKNKLEYVISNIKLQLNAQDVQN